MFIKDVLSVKGGDLYSIAPDDPVTSAVDQMVAYDIGSLLVIRNGEMVGLLTKRDIIRAMKTRGCSLKDAKSRKSWPLSRSSPIQTTPWTTRATS
jgi:CBS domain-containing protein